MGIGGRGAGEQGAGSRGAGEEITSLSPSLSTPNTQCPMPNAQCPMPNSHCLTQMGLLWKKFCGLTDEEIV